MASPSMTEPHAVGRYLLFEEIACGGMATVHIGRMTGEAGFKRTVAFKRLHAHLARDPDFVAMFVEEALLAARIQHPNVVSILDVIADAGELSIVMEYVHGESLWRLLRSAEARGEAVPPAVVAQIVTGMLYGLHAAHEAKSVRGAPLQIVHRDVSPQNVIVGVEGVSRVLDFGVAKAVRVAREATKDGVIRGKVAYMAPEQLLGDGASVDRRVDIYAAGVVLWEALAGERMWGSLDPAAIAARILTEEPDRPSMVKDDLPAGIDGVVMKALSRNRDDRYATALEFARAIEEVIAPIPIREVSDWVLRVVDDDLSYRAQVVARVEQLSLPPPRAASESLTDPEHAVGAPRCEAEASSVRDELAEVSGAALPAGVPPRSPMSRMFLLLGAGIVVLAIGAWSVMKGPASARLPAGLPGPATGPVAPAPPPVPAAPIAAIGTNRGDDTGAKPPSDAPLTTPGAPSPPDPPLTTPGASPSPSATASARLLPASPRRRCIPPWTLDAHGVRILKRECL